MRTLILATSLIAAGTLAPTLAFADDKPAAAAKTAAMPTDGEALAVLTAVNDHEVKSADLAQEKKVGPDAMAYADMLEKEHEANQKQTDQTSRKAGVNPLHSPDVEMLKLKSTAKRDKLRSLEGAAFEAAWIGAMVEDHQEALTKIDAELLPNAKNPAVAEHLRKTREHIAHHLEQARALQGAAQASTSDED